MFFYYSAFVAASLYIFYNYVSQIYYLPNELTSQQLFFCSASFFSSWFPFFVLCFIFSRHSLVVCVCVCVCLCFCLFVSCYNFIRFIFANANHFFDRAETLSGALFTFIGLSFFQRGGNFNNYNYIHLTKSSGSFLNWLVFRYFRTILFPLCCYFDKQCVWQFDQTQKLKTDA